MDGVDPLGRGAFEHRREQPFLVPEVVVDGGLGDARALGETVDACRRVSARGEELHCRLENPLTADVALRVSSAPGHQYVTFCTIISGGGQYRSPKFPPTHRMDTLRLLRVDPNPCAEPRRPRRT